MVITMVWEVKASLPRRKPLFLIGVSERNYRIIIFDFCISQFLQFYLLELSNLINFKKAIFMLFIMIMLELKIFNL